MQPSEKKALPKPMTDIDYGKETLRRMERVDQYTEWMCELIRPYLGREIFEVGCGIGTFTERFIEGTARYTAVDVREDYVSAVNRRFGHVAGFNALVCDATAVDNGSELSGYDTVICLNVLEHVQEDEAALKAFNRLLAPGGALLLQVPAHQSIYSQLDANIHHYRRYSRSSLGGKLKAAGFKIDKLYYSNAAGAFGWFFVGKVLRRQLLPETSLGGFNLIAPLLQKIESIVKPPFGLSLMAVARRI